MFSLTDIIDIMDQITINIPKIAIERITNIIENHGIFEDHEDFILHAIIDLLEEYK